jgi:hypothetical protein
MVVQLVAEKVFQTVEQLVGTKELQWVVRLVESLDIL